MDNLIIIFQSNDWQSWVKKSSLIKSRLIKWGLLIMHLKPAIQSCFSCSRCSQKHFIGFFKGCWNSVVCTTWLLLFQIVLVIKFPAFLMSAYPPPTLLKARAGNLAWLLPRLQPVSKTPVPLLLCCWLCLLLLLDWASWSAVAGLLCGWFGDAPGSSCLPPSAGQSCHVSGPSACQYSLHRAGTARKFPILCKWFNLPKGDYSKKGATLWDKFF